MGLFGTNKEVATIVMQPTQVAIALLSSHPRTSIPMIRALSVYPCTAYDMHDGILYHREKIIIMIRTFLRTHTVQQNIPGLIALHGPQVKESFIATHHATPTQQDLHISEKERLVWQHQYLYPDDTHGFIFYVSGMYPWVLYEYQQLAHRCGLSLTSVMSQTSTGLSAYRKMYGSAYRAIQLQQVMQQHQHTLHEFFSRDILARLITHAPKMTLDYDTHRQILVAMAGLWYAKEAEHA